MDHQGSGGRTPVRGFPPGRRPPEPAEDVLGPWPTPGGPPAGADGGEPVSQDDGDPTATMAAMAPVVRRRGGKADGARTRRRSRPVMALIAAAVVLGLAAAVFAGYQYLYKPSANAPVPPTLRLPTNAPGSPGFDKALGKWQHIGSRAGDPRPLSITELYPPQFVLGGSSYLRTAASTTKNCSLAVYGAQLQAALQSGHCSQALRASYISGGDGRMMGTIGVLNLISSAAAQKAGQATGPQEIIAPLSSRSGPTRKLGNGTGIVLAKIKGHYLILMWAEFTNLKSPSTPAARQLLEQFTVNLLTGSANINLSARMLAGKA